MSYPVYYVPAGDVLPILFDTFDGGTGASITMSGLAVTDIEIYRDGSTTQRASDAGYTLLDTDGIDFDSLTGIHGFSIDTGDNTDASFYTVGSWFHVVVSAITVDAQTVSFIAAAFRIMAAEAVAGKPKVDVDAWLGTAAATPTVAGVPEVDVTHIAGSTTDVSTIPASVAAILVDTGTTLQGELDGIQADTEDIQTRLPAALVGGRIDATVDGTGLEAAAAAVIADAVWDEAATGHTDAGKAGEQLWTDVDAILTDTGTTLDGKLDTIDDFLDTEVAAIKTKTDQLTFTVANQVDANALTIDEDEILDDSLADSVPADGALPTVRQALYMLVQFMTERSVSGTTVTVNKVDGSTSLMTFTLDDGTNPTSITRAT